MELGGQLMATAGVLSLLAALLWWLRRRGWAVPAAGGRAAGRRLQTMERLPLGPQHTLHLVRMGDEALLVACSPGGCTLLDKAPAAQLAGPGGVRP